MAMASVLQVRMVGGTTYIPLLRPPPAHLERVPLSFFDASFLPWRPLQRLYLFDHADNGNFHSYVRSLKSSLAEAVTTFFPLAGKLTYVPSSGDVVVDCSPSAVGPGVAFHVAEAEGNIGLMCYEEAHDVPSFLKLVPVMEVHELPAAVLAVQVTRFGGSGGMAVGVSVHHALVDGPSFTRFMSAWSSACRGESVDAAPPTFERSVIVHPTAGDMARRIIRKAAPDLPKLPRSSSMTWREHVTITLVLSGERINQVKNQLHAGERRPSTFVAVSALVWVAAVRSRCLDGNKRSHLMFPASCRSRLTPPVDDSYFGVCLRAYVAEATAGELGQEGSLRRASTAIQDAIDELAEDPLAGFESWAERTEGLLRQPGCVALAGTPRIRAYDTSNFGWGRPSRAEMVSDTTPEGMVFLAAGRDQGSVQIAASLHPAHVQGFKAHILGSCARHCKM